ncbi:hypothetical protein F4781DRAFT_442472 [Annulohypoxylon bovei var. microspora]|nr:hypothetical protein F4781DRAFT_442472 [Annulohypoxylon bovei var. microspora]
MEASQGSTLLGKKRRRDDYNSDDQLPIAKRQLCFFQRSLPPHPLMLHNPPTTMTYTVPSITARFSAKLDLTGDFKGVFNYNTQQLQQNSTQLSMGSDTGFPQFRMLPSELRLKANVMAIWRETWEHRGVKLVRETVRRTPEVPGQTPAEVIQNQREYRWAHVRATMQHWGIKQHESNDYLYCSLEANKMIQSRDETLMHFKLALKLPHSCPYNDSPSGLSISHTFVYFNFDLDRLVFPLHSPLSTAFSQPDLSRLTRVSIPELAPALTRFTGRIGPFENYAKRVLPKVDDEDQVVRYDEFKYVWRLLREWFPSLREIHLDTFQKCNHYKGTSSFPTWHLINGPPCRSCLNIQTEIIRRFPKIGMDVDGPQHHLDRVLEGHDIIEPVFKKETLVIGRVKGVRGNQDENVTVTYQAIYDADSHKNVVDLKGRARDWALVRRKVVAKTLEHALGPPPVDEPMIYKIKDTEFS